MFPKMRHWALRKSGCFAVVLLLCAAIISLLWPFSTDIVTFSEFHWMLSALKSIQLKDFVKVASRKLVNPYPEFAIIFGKGVGIGEVNQVRYSCAARVCFPSVKFA